jgi:hypothetical protein
MLKYNGDGLPTLYFQSESLGKDNKVNWPLAQSGDLLPMLRMYWPKTTPPSTLDGSWPPPAAQCVGS